MPRSEPTIPIIDLFAGPGGLGEGFTAFAPDDGPRFQINLSVEYEPNAHATLQLRSFVRQFGGRDRWPDTYFDFLESGDLMHLQKQHPLEWAAATEEAIQAELGVAEHDQIVERRVAAIRRANKGRDIVLIGGPPCQAYSLIGRARNRGIEAYEPEHDRRHYLYEEYLAIIRESWPAIFVMENVKGILSSRVSGEKMIGRIMGDLSEPDRNGRMSLRKRYQLCPVVLPETDRSPSEEQYRPSDFIVRAEDHGVPQARHRVFIMGVREDVVRKAGGLPGIEGCLISRRGDHNETTVHKAIHDLPDLRSGLSKGDSLEAWRAVLASAQTKDFSDAISIASGPEVARVCEVSVDRAIRRRFERGGRYLENRQRSLLPSDLASWLHNDRLPGVCNHETRGHIPADLHRYLFAAAYAKVCGISPTLADFPDELLPEHRNVKRAIRGGSLFSDRFRVQVRDRVSSTVTSHISKDGHYYIHYDPVQCRSLTVREAARLQTFPDDYCFMGGRTAQYVQVGNAVPPWLARQIAEVVHSIMRKAGRFG